MLLNQAYKSSRIHLCKLIERHSYRRSSYIQIERLALKTSSIFVIISVIEDTVYLSWTSSEFLKFQFDIISAEYEVVKSIVQSETLTVVESFRTSAFMTLNERLTLEHTVCYK